MISQYQGNASLGQDFEKRSKEDAFCTKLKVLVKNLHGSWKFGYNSQHKGWGWRSSIKIYGSPAWGMGMAPALRASWQSKNGKPQSFQRAGQSHRGGNAPGSFLFMTWASTPWPLAWQRRSKPLKTLAIRSGQNRSPANPRHTDEGHDVPRGVLLRQSPDNKIPLLNVTALATPTGSRHHPGLFCKAQRS